MSKPTLTSQVRDGQLQHILHVAGSAFQTYATRAAALCALALALELTGCQTIEQHPRVSAFIAGSLVLTAGGALRHNGNDSDRHVSTPSVDCSTGSCK